MKCRAITNSQPKTIPSFPISLIQLRIHPVTEVLTKA